MTAVRVTVDPAACECSGYCERIAATVFSLADEFPFISVEMPVVSDREMIERVLEAEATCPGRAILVERVPADGGDTAGTIVPAT